MAAREVIHFPFGAQLYARRCRLFSLLSRLQNLRHKQAHFRIRVLNLPFVWPLHLCVKTELLEMAHGVVEGPYTD